MFLIKFRTYGSQWSVNKWTLACKVSYIPSLFNYNKWRKWEGTCTVCPLISTFGPHVHSVLMTRFKSSEELWARQLKHQRTPVWGQLFFLVLLLLMELNWANYFNRETGKGRNFTWPKRGEETVFHLFQGGTGKQQLATDENKMLGNEEIRNTKELELIKINDQSIFGERG